MNNSLITNWTYYARVFVQLLLRDIVVYSKRLQTYGLNFAVFYPVVYAISWGYLQINTYLASNNSLGSILFIGNVLTIFTSLTFDIAFVYLYDKEHDRFIDYQMLLIKPTLVLIERIIFATLFTFIISLPFFSISKLILGNLFDVSKTNWMHLLLILLCSSLVSATYNFCAVTIMTSTKQTEHFWMRFNIPLFTLGGWWAPWFIVNSFSTFLGVLTLFNPFMYITEGLRRAITGNPHFLSIQWCCFGMLTYSLVFTVVACYYFKKRLDHI